MKLSLKVLNKIVSLFKNISTKISYNNMVYRDILLSNSVLQGEMLSALLFNLFLSDIEEMFDNDWC